MALIKISDPTVPELTELSDDTLFMVVDDPSGSPQTKKINFTNLIASIYKLPTEDGEYQGTVLQGTAGEDLALGDVCYLKSDGKFWLADADTEATSGGLIVLATDAVLTGDTGVFLEKGFIKNDTWSWLAGSPLFISQTPGHPTDVEPVGEGIVSREVGCGFSTTVVWFNPKRLVLGSAVVENGIGLSFEATTKPAAAAEYNYVSPYSIVIPANCTGSGFYNAVNPSAEVVISIKKNGTEFATCTVSTGGVATFASSETALTTGDRITFVFPASQDSTWAGIAITIKGTRS